MSSSESLSIEEHYSRPEVKEEIARFSRGRWIGIHCSLKTKDGRPILLRYDREKPINISNESQVVELLSKFKKLRPRTIYATANIYSKLFSRSDVSSLKNIVGCMPTWDLDNELDDWRATIEAAREIRDFLESKGISISIIKWSGRGVHVHIHQNSISKAFRKKVHPLDIAYAIVEFTNLKLKKRFDDIRSRMRSKKLSVDNEMDQQRLFTAPLSLHKELDMVAVVIDPNKLDSFDPSFAKIGDFKHFKDWDRFIEGEADTLAKEALDSVGGYFPISSNERIKGRHIFSRRI
ncbi:MAG: hypothetical protein ACUVTL_02290 [Thermoproteota archaeon]